ncbi:methyltransferase [Xylaria bambusicola]|uniref:methyltransferase n=1 Tax=Xylaria bambusicola TaxID=326684 RepID=UPI002007C39D|nr:methyltransferase [Xylaria bambusicola]KAI0508620.1 methyltransferase [Xylaria bambusicola]
MPYHPVKMVSVQSKMSFLSPLANGESPYVRGNVEEGFPRQNFTNSDHLVQFEDARQSMDAFQLDVQGFMFVEDSGIDDHLVQAIREKNSPVLKEKYYPVIENLVKSNTGATRVVIFDHTYRKRDPSLDPSENSNGKEQPAILVHVDQSETGAIGRVRGHGGADAERLLQKRAQIINVWRPINGPVRDWPLATMDYRTIQQSEIQPTDIFKQRHDRVGQTVSVVHSPDQKWYYLSGQTHKEVTLIKIWDNQDGVAKLCPHGAFLHPEADTAAIPRESIEVRCLVFYDN